LWMHQAPLRITPQDDACTATGGQRFSLIRGVKSPPWPTTNGPHDGSLAPRNPIGLRASTRSNSMAHAGQILNNPVSGETIEFVTTAADTDGELLAFELTLTPDGQVPGTHVHPEQEERFEVLSGTMKFKLGFKTITAGPGETVLVPAGS